MRSSPITIQMPEESRDETSRTHKKIEIPSIDLVDKAMV
jgi:hypothetical protein